jgi:hypothetical protein
MSYSFNFDLLWSKWGNLNNSSIHVQWANKGLVRGFPSQHYHIGKQLLHSHISSIESVLAFNKRNKTCTIYDYNVDNSTYNQRYILTF